MSTLPACTPVPVRTRTDGWTPARQWEFLQALGDTASVAEAARRVGMSERSAHRLRRHPEAEDFRAAWDAALARVWSRVEQVALDRVVNGDVEVIERDGVVVATRRRPCSDRLMIHMLQQQVRRLELQAQADAAAHERAALAAHFAHKPSPPPLDAAAATAAATAAAAIAAETAALRASHNRMQGLVDRTGWAGEAEDSCRGPDLDGAVPVLPMPEKRLEPANGRMVMTVRGGRVRDVARDGARDGADRANRKVRKTPPGADLSISAAVEAMMVSVGGGAGTAGHRASLRRL